MRRFLSLAANSPALRYAALALVVTCAYCPSLFQAARADQLVYLYSTGGKSDLFSLAVGAYSWNRDINGDIHLFRPILFFLLGLEHWAFTPHNFCAWQAA